MDEDNASRQDSRFARFPDFLKPSGDHSPQRDDTPPPSSLVDRFRDEDLLDTPEIAEEAPLYDVMAKDETPVPRRRYPWWLDIFCYPCNRSGFSTFGVMVGAPLLLILLSLACFPMMPAFPILIFVVVPLVMLSLAVSVGMLLYFVWYLCVCVRDSAAGGVRAPETMGQTPGIMELFANFFQVAVCVGVFFGLYGSLTYGASLGPIGRSTLMGILAFCLPFCLLSVVTLESLTGLNPIWLIRNLMRVMLPYVGLVLGLSLLHGSLLGGMAWLRGANAVMSSWSVVTAAGEAYLLMVSAHVLGRFNWRYRDRLDW